MPNWVFNTVMLTGPTAQIDELVKLLARPVPTDASGGTEEKELSFWNLVAPTNLPAYFDGAGLPGESWDHPLSWYSWNNKHWGCKWDAINTQLSIDDLDGVSVATYAFDTPWGPPEPIFEILEAICLSQDLLLWIRAEDEEDGQLTISLDGRTGEKQVVDLGPPESHADYVERGMQCRCHYLWQGTAPDEDEWIEEAFADCPPQRGCCAGCDAEVRLVNGVLIEDASSSAICVDGAPHELPETRSIAESAAIFLRCFGAR